MPGATVAVLGFWLALAARSPATGAVVTEHRLLENGLRVGAVHIPGSTNVSIFTFVPMGLAFDGPGHTQWSHLVEHLVIRSTVPDGAAWANAETMPDHLRLDTYGNVSNWREHLIHHTRWLKGEPFEQTKLVAEKPKIMAECDFTERNLATHKFAVAGWNQAVRHGRDRADLRADVLKAALPAVQSVRDQHFFVPAQTTVCVVGGVPKDEVFALLERELGRLESNANAPVREELTTKSRLIEWDLSTRHLLLTWRIPASGQPDHAALLVAGHLLTMRFFNDAGLKPLAGMVLAGADLTTPEGSWFYVSASLKPDAETKKVRDAILDHLRALVDDSSGTANASVIAHQLGFNLTQVPDPRTLRRNVPANMTDAVLEANVGLQWATRLHRLGARREALAAELRRIDGDGIRAAARRHLDAGKAVVLELRPATGKAE